MISTPVHKEPYFSETTRKARLEWKEDQILIRLKGKVDSKLIRVFFDSQDANSKLEFLPDYFGYKNSAEEISIRLQPLDRERIHLQIDSKIGLEFSGTLKRLSGWRKWF